MTDRTARSLLDCIVPALGLPAAGAARVRWMGEERLPSRFAVSELAAASIGAVGVAISELVGQDASDATIDIDHRLASLWFGWSIRPLGWAMPSPWDEIAGDYRTRDGWIKLHTNAPHHRAAALSVLDCAPTRDAAAAAVAPWSGEELETAVIDAGGCAAKLRTRAEWVEHTQGRTVENEPLVAWDGARSHVRCQWRPQASRPLAGLRVLDLTRVLAGPVATRILAGYGADVLRIDPPNWDEPGVIPEVALGKRCCRLDLKNAEGRDTFLRLLAGADILIHGYRADALERLGLGIELRQAARPGLIDISLNAYGHNGPWKRRRGFDSLVQFSSGIAAAGMAWKESEAPVSLPVQALDHATGYLIAAAAVRAVAARMRQSGPVVARLSLARTAELLCDHASGPATTELLPAADDDFSPDVEQTDWGPAHRLRPPISIPGAPLFWTRPAGKLGSSTPSWTEGAKPNA